MAIELATAYVSLVAETTKLEAGIKEALSGTGKQADAAGAEMGSRLARTASKALKDGWSPDKDIMAGIPNTKLDHIGARIGQVIGKGIAGGLRAQQLGKDFGSSFASGAGSIGLGSVISGWRRDLKDQPNKLGYLAGKGISAGLQVGLAGATAIIGTALKTGFDRLVTLDTAQYKLRQVLKTQGKGAAEFDKINKAVQKAVDKTPFSMDQAFGTAVAAIGAGSQDIERFMQNVTDAAGFAGTDLERMGLIFNQVLAKGKLTGEETMQLMEAGLPAASWIQDSYELTADQFAKMQEDGEVTLDMLQKSIEDHAPGMAKALGNTLQGSIDNMQTALAKTGANFLSALLGGPTGDPTESLKSAVQRLTDMLNNLNTWIVDHKDEIRDFFNGAKDAALKVGEVLGDISAVLAEHPGLIEAVVVAFAAWKTIQFVGLLAELSKVSVALTGISMHPAFIALAAIAGGGLVGAITLDNAINEMGADSEGGRNALNQATAPGMGVPGASRDPMFQPSEDPVNIPGGGGPNASRERRGVAPIMGPYPIGTAGRGYFNSRAAAAQLDARLMSDEAILARVPSGSYDGGAVSDLTQGLADCSSAVEDLVNIIDGRSTAGREMTTFNAADWLTSRGFRPGTAPGALNVGFTNAGTPHMEATLPGGTNFNWGNPADAARGGRTNSQGAFSPNLTQRYYRYDQGGILPPGTTLVQNDTGEPELVLNPEQQKNLASQGLDPNTLLHGTTQGAAPGPQPEGVSPDQPNYGMDFVRAMGFVPAAAGSTGVAGTSSVSKLIDMGDSVVGGLIDTGVNLGNMAISAAIAAGAASGSFGAAAPAAPVASQASSYGLQLLGNQGKTISSYWFGLAGILADAALAQANPFGMPRWLGYDYTAFAPQLGIQQAATTTLEKMGSDAIKNYFAKPGEGQMHGQAAGAPPGPVPGTPVPVGGPAMPGPGAAPAPPVSEPNIPAPPPEAATNMADAPPAPAAPSLLNTIMGYDQGGMLPPGGVGINMTNRPEPVLTPQQWEAMSNQQPAGREAPLVKIDAIYGMSPEDVASQIEAKQKLAMMRFAGRP